MFKKNVLIAMFMFALVGCTTYIPGRLPSQFADDYPNVIKKNDVYVAVKIFNDQESLETFACETYKKELQPIFIAIRNNSNSTYSFSKLNVEPVYIEAEKAGPKCHRSWLIGGGVWPPTLVRNNKVNKRIDVDYIAKEIKDASISPKQELSGILFVKKSEEAKQVTVLLKNRDVEERLSFVFEK